MGSSAFVRVNGGGRKVDDRWWPMVRSIGGERRSGWVRVGGGERKRKERGKIK